MFIHLYNLPICSKLENFDNFIISYTILMMPNKSSNNEIFCKILIIYSNTEQLMYYVFLFDTNQRSIYNNCDYILKISMTL
ncbi:hypothetical protein RSJ22_10525 [Clostridium botulinum]|nr:hypothetical protein RSJ22_10525 [Clostridium botulinum]